MKKTLSLILALLMAASTATFALADEAEEAEAIAEEAVVEEEAEVVVTPYDNALRFLNSKQIMIGDENGDLMANENVKRYQMALLMGRVATGWVDPKQWEDGPSNSTIFTDLLGDAADYLGAISYVYQKGIIEGYGDGTFGPDNVVTYRDALTMAVRTLGFGGGYDYPWDYIEKAVSLGLTANISDVTYTDEINRGVAGQIVYNMLFATTANGDTLAKRSFGVEYGWQDIIIVANTYGEYVAGVNEDDIKDGYVAFRILNADGTIDDTNYYVEGNYELGRVYNALFESDDKGYTDLIGASKYTGTLVENKGYTDDEGNDIDTYVIEAFLNDYKLVSKYSDKILATNKKMNNELILADAYKQTTKLSIKKDEDTPYAIDWATGDILIKVQKDGKYVDGEYTVAWYYNELLNQYYRYGEKAATIKDEAGIIGIELMDEDDVADIQKAIAAALTEEVTTDGYKRGVDGYTKSMYATLEVFDLDGDEKADYGVYEAYRFGKFSTGKVKCKDATNYAGNGDEDAEHDGYILESVDLKVGAKDTYKVVAEGACDKCTVDDAHFAAGYEPSKNEDGSYKNGYVIYGYNPSTQELKIVKEIANLGENTDVDSYVATGIVRAYSVSNKTVTIGEKTYSYDYADLAGSAFVKVNDNKGIYTDMFEGLYQQFVKYVVVDDVVVYIEAVGATKDNYIVVEGFYGIDSDNYIVVAGYSTNDLKYDTFRIGSYDGWKQGSAFNYNVIEDEFKKGSVYQITSVDADAENGAIYNVTCIGNVDNKDEITPIDGSFAEKDATVTFADGRRFINDNFHKKVSDNDKYIIIANAGAGNKPIYVYEGKAEDGWEVKGDILVKKDNLLVMVNATVVNGNFVKDVNETGYVVVLDKKILEANFDSTYGDYYYYGASTYTYEVFNLLTAKTDEVVASTNTKIKEGYIYKTIDGVMVDDFDLNELSGTAFEAFKTDAMAVYTGDAKYNFINNFKVTEACDEEGEVSKWLSKNYFGFSKEYDDLIGDFKIKTVYTNEDGTVKDIKDYKWSDLGEGLDYANAFLIYNTKNDNVVVYVDASSVVKKDVTETTPNAEATSDNKIEVAADAYITATVVYDEKVVTKNDGSKTYETTVKEIKLDYVGDKVEKDVHTTILDDYLYFGVAGTCDIERWDATATLMNEDAKNLYGTLNNGVYANHTDDSTYTDYKCDLIKSLIFDVEDFKLEGANVKANGWTEIVLDWTGVQHGNTYTASFMVAIESVNGQIKTVRFATGDGQVTVNGTQQKLVVAD